MRELFNSNTIAYILSSAFQISGAIVLIIKYFGRTKERIIDEYFPGSNFAIRDNNDIVTLEKQKVQECARRIYDNRMSFAFIAIGYVLSMFGVTPEEHRKYVLFCTIICTIILIILEKIISRIISKIFYRRDIEIEYDKIQEKADTVPTENEIEKMLNETDE